MKRNKIGLGGLGGLKTSKNVGHHLCTFPKAKWTVLIFMTIKFLV
jgi:hypothetical protein